MAALLLIIAVPIIATAQVAEETTSSFDSNSPYSKPAFYALVILAILLLGCIFQLQKSVVALAKTGLYNKVDMRLFPAVAILIMCSLIPSSSFAANASSLEELYAPKSYGLGNNAFNALGFIILTEFVVILYYIRVLRVMVAQKQSASSL
jgi:hypothetical protein